MKPLSVNLLFYFRMFHHALSPLSLQLVPKCCPQALLFGPHRIYFISDVFPLFNNYFSPYFRWRYFIKPRFEDFTSEKPLPNTYATISFGVLFQGSLRFAFKLSSPMNLSYAPFKLSMTWRSTPIPFEVFKAWNRKLRLLDYISF